MNLQETIIKINNKYRLVSKSTGRNLGTFDTKEEAEKREQQVQFFKYKNEEVKMSQEEQLEEDTIRKWKNDIKSKHGDDLNFTKHNGGYGGFTTIARKNDTIVGSFGHKNSIGRILDKLPEETEYLEEKTLTPNEMVKREEIVKSLKKKRSDFVKRYGADRAKAVMYAVATKTAKAVTEENDKKYKVSYDFYGSNRDVPLYSKSHNVSAKSPDEAVSTLKKLVGGRNHKAEEIHESELTEEQLDEMGYGSARAGEYEFARSGTAAPQKKTKFILKNKATGKVLSIHADAPSAVAARNKIGSFSTHSIIKEESLDEVAEVKTKKQIQREHLEQTGEFLSLSEINLDERIEMPQGHKYSADPITKASSEGQGRKKPQMGTKANTAAVVAAILKKTKE